MSKKLQKLLQAEFGADILSVGSQFGDEWVVIAPDAWVKVHRFLRDDSRCAMNFLMDLTAVDYPDREPRFEVVCHLYSVDKKHRLRTKTRVGDEDGEGAVVDTLLGVWAAANWLERECWDMFGIDFRGHHDQRRILLYEEFEGHPLRKDYDARKTQPLVPYRTGNVEKVAPFGPNEGMPFGRQTFDRSPSLGKCRLSPRFFTEK